MRKIISNSILIICFTIFCDGGLSPVEERPEIVKFAILPEGGNPVGKWIPTETNSADVIILDESKVPAIVDSVFLECDLEGDFSFSVSGEFYVDARVSIKPIAYLTGQEAPLIWQTIVDTLKGDGVYDVVDENMLAMPIRTHQFRLDTLGFTSNQNNLDLITLQNEYTPIKIMQPIPFCFVFHLNRSADGDTLNL